MKFCIHELNLRAKILLLSVYENIKLGRNGIKNGYVNTNKIFTTIATAQQCH